MLSRGKGPTKLKLLKGPLIYSYGSAFSPNHQKKFPLQSRNRGACWETKGIFEIHYLNVLENGKKCILID
jgi:hypothetical protein